jgi:hypothetical protein
VGLSSYSSNMAHSINDSAQTVGTATVWDYSAQSAWLYANGTVTEIPIGLQGGLGGINNSGVVAGYFNECPGCWPFEVFLYSNGMFTSLGAPLGTSARALAINNKNELAGDITNVSFQLHALLYRNGNFEDLGVLPGDDASWGNSAQ